MRFDTTLYLQAQTLKDAPTALLPYDCELDSLLFCNWSGADVTVTITDGNGKRLLANQPIPANNTLQLPFTLPSPVEKGVFMSNGIFATCSAANSVDCSVMLRVKGLG